MNHTHSAWHGENGNSTCCVRPFADYVVVYHTLCCLSRGLRKIFLSARKSLLPPRRRQTFKKLNEIFSYFLYFLVLSFAPLAMGFLPIMRKLGIKIKTAAPTKAAANTTPTTVSATMVDV